MFSDLEAKATILFANRARRLLDAMRDGTAGQGGGAAAESSGTQTPEPEPLPKEPKETRAQRREKKRFGPHPKNRRVTGITFSQENNLTPKQRREGLKRLVKQLKEDWNA